MDHQTLKPILPGACVGVLGSGQLGRMLGMAARRMGYRVATLSPDSNSPTGQIAEREWVADYESHQALDEFARFVDVVTFEFENVSAESVARLSAQKPVFPRAAVLRTAQNRLAEKNFLRSIGTPVAPFAEVLRLEDLASALAQVKLPAVLKTAGAGYDGKGQWVLRSEADVEQLTRNRSVNAGPFILEAFVPFACEASVVAARGRDGSFCHWGVIENTHRRHILDVSVAPASVSAATAAQALAEAQKILERLDVVGVMCVEFFVLVDGQVLVNELAPRPHNSGHLTIEASETSQFEQQLRAVCGLPLGSTSLRCAAAMLNILGDEWSAGEPDWQQILAVPGAHLHLYGKGEPRPGRKMGHVTVCAETAAEARERIEAVRRVISVR